jgi:hypothetical protein
MSLDAPDWQRIITTVTAAGDVPDAPDWQRIVVGSGGTPVGGGSGFSFMGLYATAGFIGVTMDPQIAINNVGLLGGTMYLMAFTAMATGPVSNVIVPINGGSTYTANETWVAIYDFGQALAGHFTLLAQSASGVAAAVWANTGANPVALSTNPTLTQGQTYVAAAVTNGNTLNAFGYTIGPNNYISPNFANYPWRSDIGQGAPPLRSTIAFSAVTSILRAPLYYID